jgi:hypothetical protein
MTDSIALRQAWEEHPRYRYRGCAPDVDEPGRAAGNLGLTLDAWSGVDREGSEPQKEREARQVAAIDVCFGCAVMVQCAAYANSITPDGKLAEPEGIWGGDTALTRHKALIAARHAQPAAPDRRFATPQKRAVLEAFAAVWDPYEVAAAAGVDVRTANWQRSNLTTLLGLPRTASRGQLLAAAAERGLLKDVSVVADDGSVPAVPPPTRMPTPPEPVTETTVEPAAAGTRTVLPEPGPYEPVRVPRPRRDRFTDIVGQLALWPVEFTEPDTSSLATVHVLFPTPAERLETAV